MTRLFLLLAALLGGLGVAAGAFGAHALKDVLSAKALTIFETANRYQMIHALALGLVALLLGSGIGSAPNLTAAGYAFLAGILVFSGSLYALSLTDIRILGAITPIGGVAFMIGWLSLGLAAWSLK